MSGPIMIIDNSRVRTLIHTACLRREGFADSRETAEVSFATVQQALDYLAAHPHYKPKLILLNGDLLKGDGPPALRRLRAIHRLKRVRIVFLTKRGDRFHQLYARWQGADYVLIKPFRTQEIVAIVSSCITPSETESQITYSYTSQGVSHAFAM